MGDANAWLPPRGVRGQLNDRFEQHTIGYLVSAPLRHWVPVLNTWAVRRCIPDGFEWRMECAITSDAPVYSGKIRLLETNDGD